MNNNGFIIRPASINDIPFLVKTIIEAEKSGTDKLPYTTIFGLTEEETKKYLSEILMEDTDGCELSISSYLIAEKDGKNAAAAAAWIEAAGGIASTILKGNLLNYILPSVCITQATKSDFIIRPLHIDNIPRTIQLGIVYVSPDFRGLSLVSMLIDEHIHRLTTINHSISEMYVQVFENNAPAIKTYKKENFSLILTKESADINILSYLPSNKKILMKKELFTT